MAISTVSRVNKLKYRHGAPAQPTQSSRKGKKAWRKNVDLVQVEDTLEGLRDEERITGGPVHARSDSELFSVDVRGDEQLKRQLRPLRSTQILAERSAVPAVFSRPFLSNSDPDASKPRTRVSGSERARLARIAHRSKDLLEGRAKLPTSEAVRQSGKYDVWAVDGVDEAALVRAMRTEEAKEYLLPIVRSHKARAPPLAPPVLPPLTDVPLPSAVEFPSEGASYNPTYESHQDLLRSAHEREAKRVADLEQAEEVRRRMEEARTSGEGVGVEGMLVDIDEEYEDGDEEEDAEDGLEPLRMPGRKTAQQRRKAARVLAEKRTRMNLAQKRQQLASLTTLKSLHRAVTNAQSEAERSAALRAEKRVARGLVGMRIGKHIVKEGDIDVQLGEDLAESLRELRPEGNLWRERWGSLVVRGKVESRVRVMAGRKQKTKEYEKHSYKQFDAQNQ